MSSFVVSLAKDANLLVSQVVLGRSTETGGLALRWSSVGCYWRGTLTNKTNGKVLSACARVVARV